MQVVIFAGGLGTRVGSETDKIPKPMIEIGGKPILWHIIKYYNYYGYKDFIILAGYKQEIIKDYFINYNINNNDIRIFPKTGKIVTKSSNIEEDWNIIIMDTGLETTTGERLLQAKKYITGDTFFLTYGDGVSNINLNELQDFHFNRNIESKNLNKITISAVQTQGKFGSIKVNDNGAVEDFKEKPLGESLINGGFMVCNSDIFDYIISDDFADTLEFLTEQKMLSAYRHNGFWKSLDTIRDKNDLEELCENNKAEWKVW